jgi:hypothetical protein
MSQLTTSQRQQQLTNILLVGNLYKSHQISNKLTEISDIQKKAIEVQNMVARGIDRLSSQVEYQIAQKQAENNEIRKNKLLRDVFFQITEEIDEIKSKKNIHSIEKYFLLLSLQSQMLHNSIDTSITDSFDEKKIISQTTKDIKSELEKLETNFSDDERKDLDVIFEILKVDENYEIRGLENSDSSKSLEFLKKLVNVVEKEHKDDPGVLYRFPFFENIEKQISSTDRNYDLEYCFEREKINFEDLLFFGKKWKSIGDFSLSLSLSVQLQIQLAKNDDLKIIEKTHKIEKKHYRRNADVPFVDYVKDAKILDEISKDIFGKKLIFPNADEREQIAEAYFKIKYKDINERLKNYIINALNLLFHSDSKKKVDEEKKIELLKKNIKEEESVVKELGQKYNFIDKIISSRI